MGFVEREFIICEFTATSLRLLRSFGYALFGNTKEVFYSCGTFPSFKLMLDMNPISPHGGSVQHLRSMGLMPSGPAAFHTMIFHSLLWIWVLNTHLEYWEWQGCGIRERLCVWRCTWWEGIFWCRESGGGREPRGVKLLDEKQVGVEDKTPVITPNQWWLDWGERRGPKLKNWFNSFTHPMSPQTWEFGSWQKIIFRLFQIPLIFFVGSADSTIFFLLISFHSS